MFSYLHTNLVLVFLNKSHHKISLLVINFVVAMAISQSHIVEADLEERQQNRCCCFF